MKIQNQRGFAVVEGILIVVVIGLLSGVGYYVYNANRESNKNQTDSSISKKEKKPAEEEREIDPTKDWKTYKDPEGLYSLRYPTSWVIADHLELCTKGLLLLGANKESVGRCASESGGQMMVGADSSNDLGSYELDNKFYPDLKTEIVTVNGVQGKKQTGTYKKVASEFDFGTPQNGDRKIVYVFFTNNRTYFANYAKPANGNVPDAVSDFDLMVKKTLKFNP